MPTMKRCRAQFSLSGPWGTVYLWEGLDVDLERVLTPAAAAVPAKGQPGTDGYVPARPAVAQFTIADAIAGREDCFEDMPPEPEPLTAAAVAAEE
jgi:hypothetical protein